MKIQTLAEYPPKAGDEIYIYNDEPRKVYVIREVKEGLVYLHDVDKVITGEEFHLWKYHSCGDDN